MSTEKRLGSDPNSMKSKSLLRIHTVLYDLKKQGHNELIELIF